jgi:hypothetical protein
MGLTARLASAATRIAVSTFNASMALFESELVARMARGGRNTSEPQGAPTAADGHTGAVTPRMSVPVLRDAAAESSDAIPIVFVHRGDSEHLAYSLAQAQHSNPASTVFLLGDEHNDRYRWVRHHRYADYFDGASAFGRIYRHFSTHSVDFELICFQRWFILEEFLAAHNLRRCVYLDSDVLLYADVTSEMRKFRRFDFTLCWNTIGCVVFVNDLDGLAGLCEFMMGVYTKRDRYQYDRLASHFAVRQRNGLPGGACDMTALQLYNELTFGRVGEASHVIDGSVYDPNINVAHPGFEMEDGVKKVFWRDGVPYGTFVRTGEAIRFNALHFNGRAKSLMRRYCTAYLDGPLASPAAGALVDRPGVR